MPKSEKKNRFSNCIDQENSPIQDKQNNPPKKSRTHNNSASNSSDIPQDIPFS